MQVKVLFFATLKEKAGSGKLTLELPDGATVALLKTQLSAEFLSLAPNLATALAAVNQEYAFEEDVIPAGAEVAFFPPVSGGSTDPHQNGRSPDILKVTSDTLDIDKLVAEITQETTGAVCVFTGVVRGQTRRGSAHDTVRLEYEAYAPMAEAKMAQVASEIRSRWPAVEGIVIVQRVGSLEAGTPTVLIACSAAHRDTGVFDAAHYGIDRLKEIVPVWKKEVGPNGENWVEGEYIPKRGD